MTTDPQQPAATDDDRAALLAEIELLRATAIKRRDDWVTCLLCNWRNYDGQEEHMDACPLSRPPGARGRDLLAAADALCEQLHWLHGVVIIGATHLYPGSRAQADILAALAAYQRERGAAAGGPGAEEGAHDELAEIVRELAAQPMLAPDTTRGTLLYECLLCDARLSERPVLERPEGHERICTWRRARAVSHDGADRG